MDSKITSVSFAENYGSWTVKIKNGYCLLLFWSMRAGQNAFFTDFPICLVPVRWLIIAMSMIIQLVERNIKGRLKDCIDEA